ncbi:MAG: hypothetical protein K1X64_03285 [Myxococcaceae bacterium]|nr:hypothetical protein [Myxococcaceae bacterium]
MPKPVPHEASSDEEVKAIVDGLLAKFGIVDASTAELESAPAAAKSKSTWAKAKKTPGTQR